MTVLHRTFHFDAPIERVFELGTDFTRYPEWNVSYPVVKEIVGEPRVVGTKIHLVGRVLGRQMDAVAEIAEIDAPRYLKLIGWPEEGGPKSTVMYHLTPAGEGTDLEFDYEYEVSQALLAQIADKLFVERTIERDIVHSAENFKALVETRLPVLV